MLSLKYKLRAKHTVKPKMGLKTKMFFLILLICLVTKISKSSIDPGLYLFFSFHCYSVGQKDNLFTWSQYFYFICTREAISQECDLLLNFKYSSKISIYPKKISSESTLLVFSLLFLKVKQRTRGPYFLWYILSRRDG